MVSGETKAILRESTRCDTAGWAAGGAPRGREHAPGVGECRDRATVDLDVGPQESALLTGVTVSLAFSCTAVQRHHGADTIHVGIRRTGQQRIVAADERYSAQNGVPERPAVQRDVGTKAALHAELAREHRGLVDHLARSGAVRCQALDFLQSDDVDIEIVKFRRIVA